jgi:hypothetical protein
MTAVKRLDRDYFALDCLVQQIGRSTGLGFCRCWAAGRFWSKTPHSVVTFPETPSDSHTFFFLRHLI